MNKPCEKCAHKEVCQYQKDFDAYLTKVLELRKDSMKICTPSENLFELTLKCEKFLPEGTPVFKSKKEIINE